MALTPDEVRQLDAEYRSFPALAQWQMVSLPVGVWDRYVERIEALRERLSDPERRAMVERSLRAAALNTGAIEGLHKADRGLTVTVVEQVASWQSAVERAEGKQAVALVEAALNGFDLALDVATAGMPVTEAWPRRVHEVVCGPQSTYTVRTAVGPQQQKLPLGRYKVAPNHVELADGGRHAYAPVDRTADEMHRLVDTLAAEEFQAAHAVVQAAFAHHALTTVHPFSDGNGRVARVLASVYLLRAASIPFLVFEDQSLEYFDDLAAADRGDIAPFARFVFDRALDTIGLAESWSRPGLPGDPAAEFSRSLESYQRLLDAAGRLNSLVRAGVDVTIGSISYGQGSLVADGRRHIRDPGVTVTLGHKPQSLSVDDSFSVVVDTRRDAHFALAVLRGDEQRMLDVRLSDVDPVVSTSLTMRLQAWLEAALTELVDELLRRLRTS